MDDSAGQTQRVVLVEDHDMVLDGLVAILSADPRFDVVGTASSLEELRQKLGLWDPTVVVVDYQLPDGKGTEVPEIVRDRKLESPVLLISGSDRSWLLDEAIEAGCAGFVSKGRGMAQLAEAITTVSRGASVFPAEVVQRLVRRDRSGASTRLTAREMEVLRLLADARSAPEIAETLTVSPHTSRNHIRAVLNKLNARSQLDAVVIAVRSGLVEITPED